MKKIIIYTLILIIFITIAVIAYFFIAEIQAKIPKEDLQKCNIEEKQFMSRKIFIITPKDEKSEKVILYLHGGAYMADATQNHWNFIENLSYDTKSTIIMPDYPLTPKYNYKDVFAMLTPLYKEILEQVNIENFTIMGDSAGGGISLAIVEKMSEDNYDLPQNTILLSPWLDTRLENTEIDEVQKNDKKLIAKTLKIAGIAYSAGEDNYLINPIDGNLSKLKNITVFTGKCDILNPDVHILQERAKEQNITINVVEEEDACHIWMIDREDENLANKTYNQIIMLLSSS